MVSCSAVRCSCSSATWPATFPRAAVSSWMADARAVVSASAAFAAPWSTASTAFPARWSAAALARVAPRLSSRVLSAPQAADSAASPPATAEVTDALPRCMTSARLALDAPSLSPSEASKAEVAWLRDSRTAPSFSCTRPKALDLAAVDASWAEVASPMALTRLWRLSAATFALSASCARSALMPDACDPRSRAASSSDALRSASGSRMVPSSLLHASSWALLAVARAPERSSTAWPAAAESTSRPLSRSSQSAAACCSMDAFPRAAAAFASVLTLAAAAITELQAASIVSSALAVAV
mmetsp:Transcript_83482/g.270067  ORF Transcript_83482/g.270067 Transcript_83482/m.270067 type:complete len:298 (-) Transcript_83482:1119-2012(-)